MTAVAATADVILLAGDRGPDDPLAEAAGVAGKTLVPVLGRAMLDRVLTTLLGWPGLGRLVVVAPASVGHQAVLAALDPTGHRIERVAPSSSPSLSVAAALKHLDTDGPVILATADHPLLDPAWIEALLVQPDADADLVFGVVEHARVMARFPGSRRTRYPFRDGGVGGANLFLFRNRRAGAMLELWRQVEQNRKQPWRIVSLLGWWSLLRFLSGRLSLDEACALLSRRAGLRVRACRLTDPLAAVDVDSAADLALVSQVLSQREGPA